MRSGGQDVGVAETPEDAEIGKGGWVAEKKMVGGKITTGTTRAHVEKARGRGEGLCPEPWRGAGVKRQSADAVVERAEHALGAPVLLRRVRASEAQDGAVRGEQRVDALVVKFPAVICLKPEDGVAKLSTHKGKKRGEHGDHVRFTAERERPDEVRKIIKQHQVILKTRIALYWRCPYVTME